MPWLIHGQLWLDLWPNEIVGLVAIPDFTSMDTHTVGCYTSQPIDTTSQRAVGLCLAGATCRNNLLISVRLVFNLTQYKLSPQQHPSDKKSENHIFFIEKQSVSININKLDTHPLHYVNFATNYQKKVPQFSIVP